MTAKNHDELDWQPRLKGRSRKGAATLTASHSARVADRAIANMKSIDRRRDRGQDVDDVVIAKLSRQLNPSASQSSEGDAERGRGMPVWAVPAGLAGVAALLVAIAAFGFSSHTVNGTVLLDRRPIADVEVAFHPDAGSGTAPVRAFTTAKGAFEVKGLATGVYKVTLNPVGESDARVPAPYKHPDSTVFRVTVGQDLSNITMYAVSEPKRR